MTRRAKILTAIALLCALALLFTAAFYYKIRGQDLSSSTRLWRGALGLQDPKATQDLAAYSAQDLSKDLTYTYKNAARPSEIIPLSQPVKAVVYIGLPDLSKLSVAEKKQKFVALLLPSILIVKHELRLLRERVRIILAKLHPLQTEQEFLNALYQKYKTREPAVLLKKLQTHPASLVLAQAALESGWGTSRFFREANNIFGVWSFSKRQKRIPALLKRGNKTVYLRKYDSLKEAIEDYFLTFANGRFFDEFRTRRTQTADPLALAGLLTRYCELGELYTDRLKQVITKNNFTQFDAYTLEP